MAVLIDAEAKKSPSAPTTHRELPIFASSNKKKGESNMENAINHSHGNQFCCFGHTLYDTEMYVCCATLVSEISKMFGIAIPLSKDVRQIAEHYRGKKVYGNTHFPQRMFIRESLNGKYELLKQYDYDCVKGCISSYGIFTKDEIIAIASAVAAFLNENNALKEGFMSLMTHYGMKYYYDAHMLALAIVRHYKDFVNVSEGVSCFLGLSDKRCWIDAKTLEPFDNRNGRIFHALNKADADELVYYGICKWS